MIVGDVEELKNYSITDLSEMRAGDVADSSGGNVSTRHHASGNIEPGMRQEKFKCVKCGLKFKVRVCVK
jgi:hypothetical protein